MLLDHLPRCIDLSHASFRVCDGSYAVVDFFNLPLEHAVGFNTEDTAAIFADTKDVNTATRVAMYDATGTLVKYITRKTVKALWELGYTLNPYQHATLLTFNTERQLQSFLVYLEAVAAGRVANPAMQVFVANTQVNIQQESRDVGGQ